MPSFWVNGIVAKRDGKPYIQLSNEKGMIGQLSMGEARKVAFDIVLMASRCEADAMIVQFFKKVDFPDVAAASLLIDFRDFRHALDMEKVESAYDAPPEGPETT